MITPDDRDCQECETCETTHKESTPDKHASACVGPCGQLHDCLNGWRPTRCPICGTMCAACWVTVLKRSMGVSDD